MALTQISTAGVKDDAVTSGKIPANAVGSSEIAANAVGSSELADNAVDRAAIQDDAVNADKITAGGVDTNALGSDSVTTVKILNANVTTDKLANDSVTVDKLADNAVATVNIANEAVTLAKLEHGTSSNNGKFLRANNGADPSFETVSIPAGTTINNQGDNRVITGDASSNTLNAESELTFDSQILTVNAVGGQGGKGAKFLNTGNNEVELCLSSNRASNNQTIGAISGKWNNNHTVAYIEFKAGDDTTNKDNGKLSFYTAPDSSTGIKEAMRIRSDSTVAVTPINNAGGNSGVSAAMIIDSRTDGGECGLYVKGHGQQAGTASPHAAIRISETGAANNASEMIGLDNVTTQSYVQAAHGIKNHVTASYATTYGVLTQMNKNVGAYTSGYSYLSNIVQTGSGGASYHFEARDNGSARMLVEFDGDLRNSNNTYGQLSDVKLKENIVDANSQWDDVKAVKVRNFNFKASTGQPTHRQIGVVAQEIETVSAGLVKTENDLEVDEKTGEGKVTGTTKMVKYSILYMKAFKALQEAMAKIEVLETKVAALEAG